MKLKDITRKTNAVLPKYHQIAGAYLFGSALGQHRPDSDIDLGLVLESINLSAREIMHMEAGITGELDPIEGHAFDVTILDLNNIIFCFRVIKEGNLIYAKNMERVTDVMEYVSRRYAEVYPRYRAALEEIIDEVVNHGG